MFCQCTSSCCDGWSSSSGVTHLPLVTAAAGRSRAASVARGPHNQVQNQLQSPAARRSGPRRKSRRRRFIQEFSATTVQWRRSEVFVTRAESARTTTSATNARKKAHAIKKSMFYMRTLHVYICVSIYTLPRMLKGFPTCFYKCQTILWHDRTDVRIFLDSKYSLLGWCKLMLYDIIDRSFVDTVNLSCLSLFLLLSI